MGMNENATVDEIYSELVEDNSPLKENKAHDLIGITLGYSPTNSILFQLDQEIPFSVEAREDLNTYKKALLNRLYSDNSTYRNCGTLFKREIASNIRDIGANKNSFNTNFHPFGYSCINIVPDEEHEQILVKNILTAYKNAKTLIK